jgi:hypothetical protein
VLAIFSEPLALDGKPILAEQADAAKDRRDFFIAPPG